MPTHDEEGKRSRYFCDDDDHDLKSLVGAMSVELILFVAAIPLRGMEGM